MGGRWQWSMHLTVVQVIWNRKASPPSRVLHLVRLRPVQCGGRPHLGVRVGGRWRFVGDVKYKRDAGPGHEADLCQLLAYVTAMGLPEATLIYAQGRPCR